METPEKWTASQKGRQELDAENTELKGTKRNTERP